MNIQHTAPCSKLVTKQCNIFKNETKTLNNKTQFSAKLAALYSAKNKAKKCHNCNSLSIAM